MCACVLVRLGKPAAAQLHSTGLMVPSRVTRVLICPAAVAQQKLLTKNIAGITIIIVVQETWTRNQVLQVLGTRPTHNHRKQRQADTKTKALKIEAEKMRTYANKKVAELALSALSNFDDVLRLRSLRAVMNGAITTWFATHPAIESRGKTKSTHQCAGVPNTCTCVHVYPGASNTARLRSKTTEKNVAQDKCHVSYCLVWREYALLSRVSY